MKKIKKYILLIIFVFVFGISNINAEGTDEKCKLQKAGTTNTIRIRTTFDKHNKYGYVYNYQIGGFNAFCMNIGRQSGVDLAYTKKLKPISKIDDKYIYQIYQVYLDHKNDVNAKDYIFGTQIALWYYIDFDGYILINSAADAESYINERGLFFENGLKETFLLAYYTKICSLHESAIRVALNNPYFSCSAYMTKNDCTEKGICSNEELKKVGRPLGTGYYVLPLTSDKTDVDTYLNLFNTKGDKSIYYYTGKVVCEKETCKITSRTKNESVVIEEYSKSIQSLAENFANRNAYLYSHMEKEYSGELYEWVPPTENYQHFVGIGACGSPFSLCKDELPKILKDFSVEERTLENKNYMKRINAIDDGVDITDIKNPVCSPTPPPGGQPCLPNYEDFACSYNSDAGSFKMSDQGSADDGHSCYFSRDIAYTTDDGTSKSSVDENLGNKYCKIKCWESFESYFPGGIANIKAGTTFFWGIDSSNGIFGNLNAMRYCSTTDIDYNQFTADFNANEADIATKYNSYMAQVNYNANNGYDSTDKCTLTKSCPGETKTKSNGCGGFVEKNGKCWNYDIEDAKDGKCSSGSMGTDPNGSSPACIINQWAPTTTTYCDSCPSGYEQDGSQCKKSATSYTRNKVTINGQDSSSKTFCTDSTDANVIDSNLDDKSTESQRFTYLNSVLGNRAELKNKINSCQSGNYINKDNIYKFVATVSLNYVDPLGINRNIDNPVYLTQSSANTNLEHTGQDTGEKIVLGCSGTGTVRNYENCPGTVLSVSKFQEYHWKFNGTYNYSYPKNDYFWYSIKETYKVENLKTYKPGSIAPYVVGYGIPTAFGLKTGFYDISVDVTGFGNNGHFDDLVKEKISTSVYNYKCPYHVVNKLFGNECNWTCDFSALTCTLSKDSPAYCKDEVKGLDIVYRVIELTSNTKKLFPGHNGNGRDPGANWATFISTNDNRFKNIMNAELIYQKPIYSIDMTPALMNEIRQDNLNYRKNGKDPYTSYTDANSQQKLECKGEGTNQTCASNYLTSLIDRNIITGTNVKANEITKDRLDRLVILKTKYDKKVM